MAILGAGIRSSQEIEEDARQSCPCATTATLITPRRFGNVIGYFAIVIERFGILIGHFGEPPKSITFDRNSRSRSAETTDYIRTKWPVTIARNTHQSGRRRPNRSPVTSI
jgi:hypothetical protein